MFNLVTRENTRLSFLLTRNHSITAQGNIADDVLDLLYFIFNPFCHLRYFFFFYYLSARKAGLDANVNRHAVSNFLVYDVRLASENSAAAAALGDLAVLRVIYSNK